MKDSLQFRLAAICAAMVSQTAFADAVSEHRPVISPDGNVVVFMRQTTETSDDWELYSIHTRSGVLERLTHSPGWDGYAVFSPDGGRLMFDRSTDGGSDAKQPHLMDLDTHTLQPLGAFEGWLSITDWSEQHGLLAFWEQAGQRDLFLLDLQGNPTRQLTDTPNLSEHDAHFSPDDSMIAFASGPAQGEGKTALEVMKPTGHERQTLVTSKGRIYGIDWAPGGDVIAYTDAPDGENGDIYQVHRDKSTLDRLTDHPGWDHMPVWSTDGSRILFTSYRSGAERMYWLDLTSGAVEAWIVR